MGRACGRFQSRFYYIIIETSTIVQGILINGAVTCLELARILNCVFHRFTTAVCEDTVVLTIDLPVLIADGRIRPFVIPALDIVQLSKFKHCYVWKAHRKGQRHLNPPAR